MIFYTPFFKKYKTSSEINGKSNGVLYVEEISKAFKNGNEKKMALNSVTFEV